jgi:hypothetical protein
VKLAIKCPSCAGYVAPVDVSEIATEVVDRSCRKCHARWRLVVTPIRKMSVGFAHRLDWTCTAGPKP